MSYYADRVFEVTFSTGTGNVLLAGPPLGYVTWFAAFGVGVARPYVIEQVGTGAWEIGTGTVIDNGDGTYSLARSVLKSSNANALVNFASGSKNVRAPLTAADADSFRTGAVLAGTAIQKDGSVAFIGDQSHGGHDITNVGKLNKVTVTQPATGATLTLADNSSLNTAGANSVTVTSTGITNVTLPSGTRTLVARDSTDTLTNKTLTSPVINTPTLNGSGGALALPAGPDTLVGRATTDTLTNKSIDAGQLTGTIAAGRMPALTGDVTTSAGAVATTIAANAVTYAKLQQVAANSLVGNSGGSLASAAAVPLTANLRMNAGSLDTVQDVQTASSPQFAKVKTPIVFPASDTTTAVKICKADGTTSVITVDTTNSRVGLGVTPGAKLDLGLSAGAPGNLSLGAAAFIGLQYSSSNLMFGFNAKADETLNDQAVVATTSGSAGYSFLRIGSAGIEYHTITGAVTAGAVASSPRMKLSIGGDVTVGHAGTALGRLESRSTSNAQLVASYDASNSMAQQVSSTGLCSWTGAGTSKGHVFTDGAQAGTGATRAKIGGTIKTIVSSAPNGTTVETDLHSATIAANTLANDGDSLEVQMNFQIPNNANNKTIKFYVDGTQILTSGAAAVAGQSAQIVATITRVSSTVTIISVQFIPETGSAWARVDKQVAQNVNWTGSIVIKATGQSSAASNDIVQRSTTINYDPANP